MTLNMIFHDKTIEYVTDALIVEDSGPLENKITVDKIAFGVTGVSSAKKKVEEGKAIKILTVNGVGASMDNIASGTVTLARGKGLKGKFKYWEHTDKIANFDSVLYERVDSFPRGKC